MHKVHKILEKVYYLQGIYNGNYSQYNKERLLLEDGRWKYCKEDSFDEMEYPNPRLSEYIFYIDFEEYKLLTLCNLDLVEVRNYVVDLIKSIEYEKYGRSTSFTLRPFNFSSHWKCWYGDVFQDDFVEVCFNAGSYINSVYRRVSARKFMTTPIESIEAGVFFDDSHREYLEWYCPDLANLTFREKAKIMIDRMYLATTDNTKKLKYKIIKPLKLKSA